MATHKKLRILCVDDDRLVLEITADLIRSMGHDVIEAQHGCAAAKAIREVEPIDVLITDIRMPDGLGGVELAEYARSVRPGLRVIYFSGMHEVPEAGDITLLRKPCTLRELRQAIIGAAH